MNITHLLFDLDNTLYSQSAKLNEAIAHRMAESVARFFHISIDEAREKRKANLPQFSTTLDWLRANGLTDIEAFFKIVHPENECDDLPFDKNIRKFLSALPFPKSILTNAPREHATRVLEKLQIADLFDSITDIRDAELRGKPHAIAYECALSKCGGTIHDTIFFDDLTKYTRGFQKLGGISVLINESLSPHDVYKNDANDDYSFAIHSIYEIEKLLHFMRDL